MFACKALIKSAYESSGCQIRTRTNTVLIEAADEDALYESIARHRALYSRKEGERNPEEPEYWIHRDEESSISFGPVLRIEESAPVDQVRLDRTRTHLEHRQKLADLDEEERRSGADEQENSRRGQELSELAAYHRVKARLEDGERAGS